MPEGGPFAAHNGGLLVWRTMHEQRAPGWLRLAFKRLGVIHVKWAAESLGLPDWTGIDWREI